MNDNSNTQFASIKLKTIVRKMVRMENIDRATHLLLNYTITAHQESEWASVCEWLYLAPINCE